MEIGNSGYLQVPGSVAGAQLLSLSPGIIAGTLVRTSATRITYARHPKFPGNYIDVNNRLQAIDSGLICDSTDNRIDRYGADAGTAHAITGATNANPCVVTSANHGFENGETVTFASVGGMTELNGNTYTVAGRTDNTFQLQGIDSTAYGVYTSGGTATRSAPSLAASTLYYAYVANSAPTFGSSDVKLSIVAPTAGTTASTARLGVYYLGDSGDAADYRHVAMVRTNASTQFVDSVNQRFIANYHNRLWKRGLATPGYVNDAAATSYSHVNTSYGQANAGTGSKFEFVSYGDEDINYHAQLLCQMVGGATPTVGLGVGENLSTYPAAAHSEVVQASAQQNTYHVRHHFTPSSGYNFLDLLVYVSTNTLTVWADWIAGLPGGPPPDPYGSFLDCMVPV